MKILILRKRHKKMLEDIAALRDQQKSFKTREAEVAAQVEAASTDEEIAAAAAAVAELEAAQKSTKERLDTIISEAETIKEEIDAAEAAAAGAAAGDPAAGDEGRSARSTSASFQRRCQDFQRTGKMVYENARSMIKRASLLTTSNGVIGPTGVSGINDAASSGVSGFIDLIKVTDCTGMASYKVAYVTDTVTAGKVTEGTSPSESTPGFGSVELKPETVGLVTYISEGIRDQSPLLYEEKVRELVRQELRQQLSKKAIVKAMASPLNQVMNVIGTTGVELFTPHLLSDIILAYGGDEKVDGAAVLVLNKADLKAFAAVRGKNEYLPVYSIVPDTANPSMGVIKDNNGLSCRYCLNQHVTALSQSVLSSSGVKGMFYGNPQCEEMALWGGVKVAVNEGYKFAEGLLTIKGTTTADADVTVKDGFVMVVGKTA